MNLRLHALNLWLRLTVKSKLRRLQDPLEMRALMARQAARFFPPPDDAHFVEDLMRRPGAPRKVGMIEALWASRSRPDRRKVILYLHGGAYLAGGPRTHRHLAAALAGAAGVRAVVPDYRLAPEHPFPAAVDDAVAVYRHLLDAGYDGTEIALAGESAGGGLVFALMLAVRRAGLPDPACAAAFSPWSDLSGTAASLRSNAKRDAMLPVERMQDVIDFYLDGHDRSDPLASPVNGDWSLPPPTMILASKAEILRDDATAMADALRKGGGDVQLELWRQVPHAWPYFVGHLREADRAVENAGAFIQRHLDAEPEAS